MSFSAWRSWSVGTRVMVRRRIADEDFRYSDVIGEVVHRDDDGLVLRTRHGEDVSVPADVIATGKVVPPAPVRRPRAAPAGMDHDTTGDDAANLSPR
jgi:hypothetical protein